MKSDAHQTQDNNSQRAVESKQLSQPESARLNGWDQQLIWNQLLKDYTRLNPYSLWSFYWFVQNVSWVVVEMNVVIESYDRKKTSFSDEAC